MLKNYSLGSGPPAVVRKGGDSRANRANQHRPRGALRTARANFFQKAGQTLAGAKISRDRAEDGGTGETAARSLSKRMGHKPGKEDWSPYMMGRISADWRNRARPLARVNLKETLAAFGARRIQEHRNKDCLHPRLNAGSGEQVPCVTSE